METFGSLIAFAGFSSTHLRASAKLKRARSRSTFLLERLVLAGDDTYSQLLRDDPDDIDEDARTLIERLKMRVLPEYILREYGSKPLVTLRDMVLWLDWIRQHQGARS